MANAYLHEWQKIARKNPWIGETCNFDKMHESQTLEGLVDIIYKGNWALGTAHYYKDICLIQQVDGYGEWLVIKDLYAFESVTTREPWEKLAGMSKEAFLKFLKRVEAASVPKCVSLEY